ncbi:hypothetical protein F0562_010443 [Nyssa sinensis]|uniref:Uncharacterized protein n=1 Tax=Nyssa sinensis TaxID=561372 RepID=A0A5J5A245_9ASTE|nr:hypothetical protein F0562_010443 [Nyssa sinensis]
MAVMGVELVRWFVGLRVGWVGFAGSVVSMLEESDDQWEFKDGHVMLGVGWFELQFQIVGECEYYRCAAAPVVQDGLSLVRNLNTGLVDVNLE